MLSPEVIFEIRIQVTKVDDDTFVPSMTHNGNPVHMRSMNTAEAALLEALLPISNTTAHDLIAGRLNI